MLETRQEILHVREENGKQPQIQTWSLRNVLHCWLQLTAMKAWAGDRRRSNSKEMNTITPADRNSRGLLVCEVLIAFRAVYLLPITLQHTFTLHKLNIRNKHRHSHDFKTSSWKIFSAFTVDVINAALSLRLTLKHTKLYCLSWD